MSGSAGPPSARRMSRSSTSAAMVGGERRGLERACADDHVTEPRMQAQRREFPSVRRDPPLAVHRIEILQQLRRLREVRRGRRVEPSHRRSLHPGRGQGERERRQVGVHDLGVVERHQPGLLRLAPEAMANARCLPTSAARALVGAGSRHPHRFQPGHPGARREARHARQAAVHHHAHAIDREAGLGDGRGEDHLAASPVVRPERPVLLLRREVAVQRHDDGLATGEHFLHPPDLPRARQEHEHVAVIARQHVADGAGHAALDSPLGRARRVAHLDRIAPADTGHHRRVTQQAAHALPVERGRHDEEAELGPQDRPGLERECQAQVGVEASFVEFVEDDQAVFLERRVSADHAGEDALGDHLDAGARTHPRVQPGTVPDGAACLLAERPRHVLRRRAGRDPPRLQHDDVATTQAMPPRAGRAARGWSCRPRAGPAARRWAPAASAARRSSRTRSIGRRVSTGTNVGAPPRPRR